MRVLLMMTWLTRSTYSPTVVQYFCTPILNLVHENIVTSGYRDSPANARLYQTKLVRD